MTPGHGFLFFHKADRCWCIKTKRRNELCAAVGQTVPCYLAVTKEEALKCHAMCGIIVIAGGACLLWQVHFIVYTMRVAVRPTVLYGRGARVSSIMFTRSYILSANRLQAVFQGVPE